MKLFNFIISKRSGVYMHFFDYFYSFIKENFNKNYNNLIMIAENKLNEFKESKDIKTDFYLMKVNINYKKVIEKLKDTKIFIDKL